MISLNARIGLSAAAVLAIFIVSTALALDRAFRDSAAAAMQEPQRAQRYQVRAYSEADGLPSAAIYDVAQDPSGRIWLVTRAGL